MDERHRAAKRRPAASPLVALPLSGSGIEVVTPVEKVLLLFAQATFSAGTVSYKAYARGILVDLTGASQRNVSYDSNNGWSSGGGAWATPVAAQRISSRSSSIPVRNRRGVGAVNPW